ncbi:cytochrome b [Legionella nagasakiensis]|uniref:cytochrome b n=1 Tax=Legionella nagasakiensis TaxID=535290 RepID=UPI001F5EE28F|nr:cytochrome b [Legionella nagasakiensis]
MKRAVVTYSMGSKVIHWLSAVIVITMLSLSFFLGDLPEKYQPLGYLIHKSFGLTVLFLFFLRILWIICRGKPSLPTTVPGWQKIMARSVQYSLYVFLFAMPMSGWIMSVSANRIPVFFGLFPVPLPIEPNKGLAKLMADAHGVIAWILIVLIVLHVAGAMKHYFIDKDRVLQSMLSDSRQD